MALFDTQLAMLANQAANALISGKDPPRQGNTHPNIVPYQPFDAADQPIIIAVGNDRQFARLAEMCGHPEWAGDERFATNARARRQPRRDRAAGRRLHSPQAGSRLVRAARSGRHSRRADQPVTPGAWRTSRRSTARWCGRSPGCRWSARRCGSTARAPIPTCLRPARRAYGRGGRGPGVGPARTLAACGRTM